jgi:anti-sigma B factor antagonist
MVLQPRSVPPDGAAHAPVRDQDGLTPHAFRLDVRPERDVVRVCPVGDVDLDTVDVVRAQLDELRAAGFTRVVLDLRGATFLDSTGLHLALEAQAASAADGWEFGIIEGPANVQRAFELAGLGKRLPFVDPAALPRLRRKNAR